MRDQLFFFVKWPKRVTRVVRVVHRPNHAINVVVLVKFLCQGQYNKIEFQFGFCDLRVEEMFHTGLLWSYYLPTASMSEPERCMERVAKLKSQKNAFFLFKTFEVLSVTRSGTVVQPQNLINLEIVFGYVNIAMLSVGKSHDEGGSGPQEKDQGTPPPLPTTTDDEHAKILLLLSVQDIMIE
ncbi:hypothetical protein Tco_1350056 [Tanacetum coccineum]